MSAESDQAQLVDDDRVARLEKRLERERIARHQAEEMLESKSRELYSANVSLRQIADDLELEVEKRTRELEAALHDAQAATRLKSQFLATMSHEIRTPLFGVIGTAELLERSSLDTTQSAQVRTIRSSGESLLTLLNQILDFSKLDAERFELQVSEFDLEAKARAVAELFRPIALARGLALKVNIAPQTRLIVGDRLRLRQIMSNLLANAVKFTSEGAIELTVSTRPVGDRLALKISVTDTGPGIPEHEREVLFEEFRQGDPSTTRVHGGTGLGLAIVSRLARLMGGEVALDSVAGIGSVFTVRVMVDAGADRATHRAPGDSLAAPEPLAGLGDLQILVAEDNPVNRMVATSMLSRLGCTPLIATDGGEAVDLVSAGGIDIVLMDLQMPVLDGLQATRRIRLLDLPRQPHIVALTANAFESDRERCQDAGMDDFLAKPFSLDDLRDLFHRLTRDGLPGSG